MRTLYRVTVLVMLMLVNCPVSADAYRPTTTVEETRRQIQRLPDDDIWWTVNGEDMRWNNLNLAKFVPTVTVYRAGPVKPLAGKPQPEVGAFEVETPEGPMSFQAFLDGPQSTTMAVLVLHHGKIVFEHYPRQQPHDKPLFWSVTKAFVSTVLAILEGRGEVDVGRPIDSYISQLKGSPYEGVAVRHVLDMASGIDCADEYEDKTSCYYQYSASIGEGWRGPDAADNPYDYIAGIPADKRFAPPGESYSYSGVDTFVLGWLVEELTGMPFQDALSREVWTRMGAEADAVIWAGRYGIPLTSGGLMARVRDVARFGLLFTPSWKVVAEQQIISDRYVKTILTGGNPKLLENSKWGNIRAEDVRHNVYQWDQVYTNYDFLKGGWAGQGLLINPKRDLVAVWTGYYKDDGTNVSVLPMLRAILEGVYGAGSSESK